MELRLLYHKYSYWVKQLLAGIVIVSTILLVNNPIVAIYNIWKFTAFLFVLFLIAGSITELEPYWVYFNLNKKEQSTLKNDLLFLAQSMGSDISTYFPAKKYDSAFVCWGTELIIGENAWDILSEKELKAVLAHEFSHNIKKGTHNKYGYISIGLLLIILLILIKLDYSFKMLSITMLAFFYIIESRFSWEVECDCDKNAIKYVPLEDFISALSKIYKGKLDEYSFRHPSPNYRIKRLHACTYCA